MGDLHCGHVAGLTPYSWQVSEKRDKKLSRLQKQMYQNYLEMLKEVGPVDILVVNGDAIDGHGKKSNGSELLTTDLLQQVDIAVECLSQVKFKKCYFTYGTPYHVSNNGGQDFQKLIADKMGGEIKSQWRLNVDGVIFDIKHDLKTTSTPTSRFNPIAKNRVWDVLRSEKFNINSADVIVRSHVHYYSMCSQSNWTAMTLPALQASCTKFGRRCQGITDWGFVCFQVQDGRMSGLNLQIKILQNSLPQETKA